MLDLECPGDKYFQTTIADEISFTGIGIHTGQLSKISIKPSSEDSGIIFCRIDKETGKNLIPALYTNVTSTQLCTKLTNSFNVSVRTVEHLMAAFIGFGIDNALVEINSSEVPILDGSSLPFIHAFKKIGVKKLLKKKKVINILKKLILKENDKYISIEPSNELEIEMEIFHNCKAIMKQNYHFILNNNSFLDEIAPARTYGFKEHASMLRQKGFALGASENNALVFNNNEVCNTEGLRFDNEPVRHKVLDCLGDIFMSGFIIKGKIKASKTGHELNNKLMHKIFNNNENWEFIERDLLINKELINNELFSAIA